MPWQALRMPSRYVPPAVSASSFNCPRCNALAAQTTTVLYTVDSENGTESGVSDGQVLNPWAGQMVDQRWQITTCYACHKSSLWVGSDLRFPDLSPSEKASEVADPNQDLPAEVLELYREAAAVLPHSKRAAAALCRAALERLTKHLTQDLPATVKLDGRLVALAKSVSSPTLQALNIVRHTGNTALHGEKDGDASAVIYLDENDATISDVFFVAINALADELITKPRFMDELYRRLPDGVRESFEAKTKG